MTKRKVWFVTGASRGFGAAFIRAALAKGETVVAASRQPAGLFGPETDNLLEVRLDVTDPAQAAEAVACATRRFGRIDVLVNNAGYALMGAVEECADAEVKAVFDTNVFGLLHVTRAVLPVMRAQGAGHIFNISSSAAIHGAPGASAYCASKFAVDGFTEALASEVKPLGIKVTLVTPGAFRTDIASTQSLRFAERELDDYAPTAGAARRALAARNGLEPNDPVKLADALLAFADLSDPPFRFVAGADAMATMERKLLRLQREIDELRVLSCAMALDESRGEG